METVLYIVVLVIALAFAGAVVFLAKILTNLKKTLSNVADLVEEIQEPINGIASESNLMLHKTNKLAEDMNEKTSRMNPIVDAFKGIGESIIDFTKTMKSASRQVIITADRNKTQINQALNFLLMSFKLSKKVKREKI